MQSVDFERLVREIDAAPTIAALRKLATVVHERFPGDPNADALADRCQAGAVAMLARLRRPAGSKERVLPADFTERAYR